MKVLIETVVEKVNEVEVEKHIFLESDQYQFILKKYNGRVTVSKDGKESDQYETLGYFTSITHAMKFIMKMKLKASTAEDLNQLLYEIHRIEKFIEEKLTIATIGDVA